MADIIAEFGVCPVSDYDVRLIQDHNPGDIVMTASVTTTLNDVNIEAVAGLAGKIQQEPEIAATKWNARVNWKGGFRGYDS